MPLIKLTTSMTEQYKTAAQNTNNAFLSTAMPIGAIIPFVGSTAPNGTLLCHGNAVSRTTYADLFNAITLAVTASTMSGSTSMTVPYSGALSVGSHIEGTGIPAGTYITAINNDTQITLSNAATATISNGTYRVFPFGDGDGSTTFNLPISSRIIDDMTKTDIIVYAGGVSQAQIDASLQGAEEYADAGDAEIRNDILTLDCYREA